MADETAQVPTEGSLDRRTVLRRGAAVGAIAWTIPVVESFVRPAAAASTAGENPCDFDIVIRFCVTYRIPWMGHWYTWQQWFTIHVTFTATGACCQAVLRAIAAFEDSQRNEDDCAALVDVLRFCGCAGLENWHISLGGRP